MSRKNKQAARTPQSTLVAPDQRDEVEVNEEIAETAASEPAEGEIEVGDGVEIEEGQTVYEGDVLLQAGGGGAVLGTAVSAFEPAEDEVDAMYTEAATVFEVTPVTIEVPTVKHTNRRPCRYPTVKLTPQAADKLHALFLGLQKQGATVGGRPVERHPDAFRWLLEQAVR